MDSYGRLTTEHCVCVVHFTPPALLACLSQEISCLRADKAREAKEAGELVEVKNLTSGERGFGERRTRMTHVHAHIHFQW